MPFLEGLSLPPFDSPWVLGPAAFVLWLAVRFLVKRLHARFRQEGVVFPCPTRTLDLPPSVLPTLGRKDVDGPAR
jgi:hypothetical protein